jgi:hypothetical protein
MFESRTMDYFKVDDTLTSDLNEGKTPSSNVIIGKMPKSSLDIFRLANAPNLENSYISNALNRKSTLFDAGKKYSWLEGKSNELDKQLEKQGKKKHVFHFEIDDDDMQTINNAISAHMAAAGGPAVAGSAAPVSGSSSPSGLAASGTSVSPADSNASSNAPSNSSSPKSHQPAGEIIKINLETKYDDASESEPNLISVDDEDADIVSELGDLANEQSSSSNKTSSSSNKDSSGSSSESSSSNTQTRKYKQQDVVNYLILKDIITRQYAIKRADKDVTKNSLLNELSNGKTRDIYEKTKTRFSGISDNQFVRALKQAIEDMVDDKYARMGDKKSKGNQQTITQTYKPSKKINTK